MTPRERLLDAATRRSGQIDERGYLTLDRLRQGSEEHRIVPVATGFLRVMLRVHILGRLLGMPDTSLAAKFYVMIHHVDHEQRAIGPETTGVWWFVDLREAQDAWAGDDLVTRWALGDRGRYHDQKKGAQS